MLRTTALASEFHVGAFQTVFLGGGGIFLQEANVEMQTNALFTWDWWQGWTLSPTSPAKPDGVCMESCAVSRPDQQYPLVSDWELLLVTALWCQ